MQQYRRGEEDRSIPPRAERFFKLGDDWYFNMRGGKVFGPFPCREEAEAAVKQSLDTPVEYTGNIRPFGSQRARQWRNSHKP